MRNHNAYEDAIRRNIFTNAIVGRIQRLDDEEPEIMRLVKAIEEDRGEKSLVTTNDARSLARQIYAMDWGWIRDLPFELSLVYSYLKGGKLSDKQREWVTKLANEIPNRAEAREKRRRERAERDTESDFIGTVGERDDYEAVVEFTKMIDGRYGTTVLVKMRDDDGNILATFSSSEWVWSVEEGDRVEIRGTVKEHTTYRGAKQTMLTRTKRQDEWENPIDYR